MNKEKGKRGEKTKRLKTKTRSLCIVSIHNQKTQCVADCVYILVLSYLILLSGPGFSYKTTQCFCLLTRSSVEWKHLGGFFPFFLFFFFFWLLLLLLVLSLCYAFLCSLALKTPESDVTKSPKSLSPSHFVFPLRSLPTPLHCTPRQSLVVYSRSLSLFMIFHFFLP